MAVIRRLLPPVYQPRNDAPPKLLRDRADSRFLSKGRRPGFPGSCSSGSRIPECRGTTGPSSELRRKSSLGPPFPTRPSSLYWLRSGCSSGQGAAILCVATRPKFQFNSCTATLFVSCIVAILFQRAFFRFTPPGAGEGITTLSIILA